MTGLLALLALLLVRAPLPWLSVALIGVSLSLAIFIRPAWGLLLLALDIPFSTVGETTLAGAAVGPLRLYPLPAGHRPSISDFRFSIWD